MPTNYKNNVVDVYTDLNTLPRYSTKTGKMSSSGVFVTGENSLFLSEIGGDAGLGNASKQLGNQFLFNGLNEVRRITAVVDNTHLTIDKAFSGDMSNASVRVIAAPKAMRVTAVTASGGKVDNLALVPNVPAEFGTQGDNAPVHPMPLIIDGTGGTVQTTAFYFATT